MRERDVDATERLSPDRRSRWSPPIVPRARRIVVSVHIDRPLDLTRAWIDGPTWKRSSVMPTLRLSPIRPVDRTGRRGSGGSTRTARAQHVAGRPITSALALADGTHERRQSEGDRRQERGRDLHGVADRLVLPSPADHPGHWYEMSIGAGSLSRVWSAVGVGRSSS